MRSPAPVGTPPQTDLEALFAERARSVNEMAVAEQTCVQVALHRLDIADVVRGARAFAAGLSEEEAHAWMGSWTRTRFLFGNPRNLPDHTPPRVVAPAGTTAWLGPHPLGHAPGASRLLRPLTGSLPQPPPTLDVPPAYDGPPRRLHLATRHLTLVRYLVHLHHIVAEATLLGHLAPTEPLRLLHRPDLDMDLPGEGDNGRPGYARVHYATDRPSALRLYGWLAP